MQEFDPALELDLSANEHASRSLCDLAESAPKGLDSLAFELAQAEDDDKLSNHTESDPGRLSPPYRLSGGHAVKASARAAMSAPERDDDIEAAFSHASSLVEDTMAPADLFLDRLRTSVDSSTRLEQLSSSLLRSLASLLKQREAQVRDLHALTRALNLLTPLQASSIEPLDGYRDDTVDKVSTPEESADVPPTPFSASFPGTKQPNEYCFNSVEDVPLVPAAMFQHLKGLHASTASLLSSLNSINEATQEHRAAQAEASRRLGALRTTLASWRAELEDLESDKMAIDLYGRRNSAASATAEAALEMVRRRLEEAESRAVRLLTCAIVAT